MSAGSNRIFWENQKEYWQPVCSFEKPCPWVTQGSAYLKIVNPKHLALLTKDQNTQILSGDLKNTNNNVCGNWLSINCWMPGIYSIWTAVPVSRSRILWYPIAHLVISRERPRTLPIWIAFRSSGSQEPAVYKSVLLFYCYEFSNQLGRLFYRPEFWVFDVSHSKALRATLFLSSCICYG